MNVSASRREQTPELAKKRFRRIGSFGSLSCSSYLTCSGMKGVTGFFGFFFFIITFFFGGNGPAGLGSPSPYA